jgi:hypothetical protein
VVFQPTQIQKNLFDFDGIFAIPDLSNLMHYI